MRKAVQLLNVKKLIGPNLSTFTVNCLLRKKNRTWLKLASCFQLPCNHRYKNPLNFEK